jgi:hypothetical protein
MCLRFQKHPSKGLHSSFSKKKSNSLYPNIHWPAQVCGILPISTVRKIQNCSLTYKDATDFVFSVVMVAKRHNLSHLYVGLPVNQLLLANVYLFNKVIFISEMAINRQHANKSATCQ